MTIRDIVRVIERDTKIYAKSYDKNSVTIDVTYLLMSPSGFANLVVHHCQAIGKNEVEIFVDVPSTVLEAWGKYSDDYYNEED